MPVTPGERLARGRGMFLLFEDADVFLHRQALGLGQPAVDEPDLTTTDAGLNCAICSRSAARPKCGSSASVTK